ncbi:MAG TPA: dihydrolipoamide acetyltransferase family protein [Thermoplasmata archaeon]|nr:dihydrolipoamide acetyltransferase family protein [Thermoplasmata archaeon]
MAYEFRLPDIGEGVAEGEIVEWFVHEGETVREDAPLVSVLTDKANVEIPSPKAGRVAKLHARVGEKVKVGGLLVTIETGAAETAAPAPAAAVSRGAAPAASTPAPTPVPAPASAPATRTEPAGGPSRSVLASPSVRRRASELGIDLSSVAGSGPGGRVTDADLDSAARGPSSAAPGTVRPAPPPTASAPTSAPGSGPAPATADRIPLRGVRRVIAEHMTESVHRAAHYTYVEEVDASELVRLRERMAVSLERKGVKLSYLPFIVKAVIAGLRQYPTMNARMDDEKQELVLHREFGIGIATAAPEGLIVPVVKNADAKSLAGIAREIAELAEKARAGKLTLAELSGGTFTITSLGALGGVLATPILNYPEVAILGVHRIVRRPVYRPDGSIGPADLLNLSVSLDHRVLDGIVGAQFLAVVKSHLEDPHQLLADLA